VLGSKTQHKSKPKVLLVEDEDHLAFNLKLNLNAEGFEVFHAENGAIGLSMFKENGPFSVILMDVMLPEMNGFEVVEKIRELDSKTGILMLTARAGDKDRMKGLGLGVDDYITKPFHLKELLMKIKRTAQRAEFFESKDPAIEQGQSETLIHSSFTLDPATLKLDTKSGSHRITALEADMLRTFFKNSDKVLSRNFLLDTVWKVKGDIETRTVDNFVVRLRKYIEDDPSKPRHLISVRGRGYQLVESTN